MELKQEQGLGYKFIDIVKQTINFQRATLNNCVTIVVQQLLVLLVPSNSGCRTARHTTL